MRLPVVMIALLAVLVVGVSVTANCQHQGKAMALADGRLVPMKCYWTGRAELALAVPLLATAVALGVSRRKESRRALAALLGAMVILLPAGLIGVCQHPEAICSLVMKPALTLLGSLVMAISLAAMVLSKEHVGRAAAHTAADNPR